MVFAQEKILPLRRAGCNPSVIHSILKEEFKGIVIWKLHRSETRGVADYQVRFFIALIIASPIIVSAGCVTYSSFSHSDDAGTARVGKWIGFSLAQKNCLVKQKSNEPEPAYTNIYQLLQYEHQTIRLSEIQNKPTQRNVLFEKNQNRMELSTLLQET
ncbi:hypothetical protein Glove_195g79 [Diversispora epigaea]|uniref:Uncharacterized protein n=1 Tax=Diversispora epigaea TaxID=1348612 RepID=A0A397IUK9_9GLOM|nr:hypothetical protein Glove_195g79 [Diversispora epigaea]